MYYCGYYGGRSDPVILAFVVFAIIFGAVSGIRSKYQNSVANLMARIKNGAIAPTLELIRNKPRWMPLYDSLYVIPICALIAGIVLRFSLLGTYDIRSGYEPMIPASISNAVYVILIICIILFVTLGIQKSMLPVPKVSLSKNPVSVEEETQLQWSVPYNYDIDKLYISTELQREDTLGSNETTYGRNDLWWGERRQSGSSYTTKQLFVEETLDTFEFTGSSAHSGTAVFTVPKQLMAKHYEGKNIRYFWSVNLWGEKNGKKVVDESFEFILKTEMLPYTPLPVSDDAMDFQSFQSY